MPRVNFRDSSGSQDAALRSELFHPHNREGIAVDRLLPAAGRPGLRDDDEFTRHATRARDSLLVTDFDVGNRRVPRTGIEECVTWNHATSIPYREL